MESFVRVDHVPGLTATRTGVVEEGGKALPPSSFRPSVDSKPKTTFLLEEGMEKEVGFLLQDARREGLEIRIVHNLLPVGREGFPKAGNAKEGG